MRQVIVLRKDLNMSKGKLVPQGAHASMVATLENMNDLRVKKWLDGSFTKIAVSCDSLEQMLALYEKAILEGYIASFIVDNGATKFNGVKTPTCIAIGPDTDERMAAITGHLKLL